MGQSNTRVVDVQLVVRAHPTTHNDESITEAISDIMADIDEEDMRVKCESITVRRATPAEDRKLKKADPDFFSSF